jgi:hypothetical protein
MHKIDRKLEISEKTIQNDEKCLKNRCVKIDLDLSNEEWSKMKSLKQQN